MFRRRYTFDGQPIYLLGEGVTEVYKQIEIQDFYSLRQKCLNSGILFEDSAFPAIDKSLYYSRSVDKYIKWLRPIELCENPSFFVEGYSRFDVNQGRLGDCWFIAAVANLTLDQKLFRRVVCEDNSFQENYAGIFHFCFWRFGTWVDVVIDDRLPTYGGKLLYMHSANNKEFWSALLEKAYAKLHGSYELLSNGNTSEALEDFTGGISEMFMLNSAPADLFNIIRERMKRQSMMGCSIKPDPYKIEAETPQGLVKGHAYSITKAQYVEIFTPNKSGKIPLLRIRNPWGNQVEWNGPWSDKSREWRYIPDHVKEKIGLSFENDGEFWISYTDFLKYFDRLDICNLTPDSFDNKNTSEMKCKWNSNFYHGEWVVGLSAGGCRNFLESYHKNPQYHMKLEDSFDKVEDHKSTVFISLMQKNRRVKRVIGLDFLTIGFEVYQVKETELNPRPLRYNFFKNNRYVARTPQFINLRTVSGRFELPAGHYVIVPSTFEPNKEGEFLIRVFSASKNHFLENDEAVRIGEIDARVYNILPDIKLCTPERLTIERIFLDISSQEGEIGWEELKQVLDRFIRKEFIKDLDYLNLTECYQSNLKYVTPKIEDNSEYNMLKGIRDRCWRQMRSFLRIFNLTRKRNISVHCNSLLTKNELNNETFSKDCCRSMVAMLDVDRSGRLGLEEFKILLFELAKWKAVFKLYDKDHNNRLDTSELRDALGSAGFFLNNHVLRSLLYRYGSSDHTMTIDDFILCAIKVKTMIERFREKDSCNVNQATFTLDEWISKSIYS